MRINFLESSRWKFYPLLILTFFLFSALLKWSLSPTFIDIYYHLSVMLGFNEAGGFVKEAFWEYAPIERIHLYPPLFHFLMLIFYKLGASALFIGRFFEFIIYPLLLLVLWRVISVLFYERVAFFSLLIASSLYSFYLSAINLIPASIAVIFGLLAYLSIEKKRILGSSVFLCLAFYTHSGIPWFFVGSLILYGILNRERLKDSLITVFFALILACPILIYEYNFREYVSLAGVYENFLIEINLWLFIAAIPGFFIALKKKKRYFIFVSLFLMGILMLFFKYRYRYLCGHGILGLIFLSALSLDKIYDKFSVYLFNRGQRDTYLRWFIASILIFFFIFSPTLQFKDKNFRLVSLNSTYMKVIPSYYNDDFQRGNEISIYFSKFWKEIVDIVKVNSGEDDIIYSNLSYVNGLISIFSNRATSTAMLKEVRPFRDFDPIQYSRLIIWIKNSEGIFDKDLSIAIDKYNLARIAETEIAYIYKNPSCLGKKRQVNPAVPNYIVYGLLFILIGLIVWENIKRNPHRNC